jgi:hypothetical protein
VRRLGFGCLLAVALAVSGCGGSSTATSTSTNASPPPGSIAALLARPGADVALAAGTSAHVPGPIRVSFLVVRHDGSTVDRPTARVWIASGLRQRPYEQGTATLEPIGVPNKSRPALGGAQTIYVAHLKSPRPGRYWLLAEPVGASPPIQGIGNVTVSAHSSEPAIGARAIPSKTPTIASTHGNFRELTTASPPDRALLRYSVAESIAAHKPFVVVFATPKYCTSRTCGPVVDVVDAVRKRFTSSDVRFIHVEVYKNNNPQEGYNRWFKQWRLPSEPWIFLVGSDSRVKAKFEGPVSVDELAKAVRANLVG